MSYLPDNRLINRQHGFVKERSTTMLQLLHD